MPHDPVFGPGLTDADRWQAWARAYVEVCQRIVDEATERPGRAAASSADTLRRYIDLLRELGTLEPPINKGLVIIPTPA